MVFVGIFLFQASPGPWRWHGKTEMSNHICPSSGWPQGSLWNTKGIYSLCPLLVSKYGCVWAARRYSPSGALIRRECPAISQIISEVDKWWSHHVYLALCLNLFWSLKLYDYIICSFETEFFSFFPPFSYFHFHFFTHFPIDINMIKVFSDLCYTTTVNFH